MSKKPLSAPAKFLMFVLMLLVLGALLAAATIGWGIKFYNASGDTQQEITVIIPKGTGLESIAKLLEENGVVKHPYAFSVIAVALNKSHLIKAGEYAFPAGVSPKDVLDSLVEGKTVIHRLTVPEGLMTRQVLEMVANEQKLTGELPVDIGEGELLPETYYFSRGDSRSEIIARMKRDMRAALMDLWEKRRPDLPFRTPQEALVLASIVEKETGEDNEYGMVASVYINRLNINMPLQADPTVIYGITKGKEPLGRLLKTSDLRAPTPYNTYVNNGLPPGPIANPGRKALEGVFNPAETDYIFFVADGKGGHNFSKELSQHNAYVTQFRSLLKDQKAKAAATVSAPSKPAVENALQEVPLSDTPVAEDVKTGLPDTSAAPVIAPEPIVPEPVATE